MGQRQWRLELEAHQRASASPLKRPLLTNSEQKKGSCRRRERILGDAHLAWHAEPEQRQQLRTG